MQRALERLSIERAFLVSARFGEDRAEIRYWDECTDADEAIRQALSLWGDDEVATRLPGWRVIGLEVVDRPTAGGSGTAVTIPGCSSSGRSSRSIDPDVRRMPTP